MLMWSFSDTYMAKHMHCIGPNLRRSELFRDSASEPQQHRPESVHQPEGMLHKKLSILQYTVLYIDI